MKNRQIDILLSTYNGEKYISHLLKSIQNQGYDNWRLWIRDDGSIDDTCAICSKYAETDDRFHIFQSVEQRLGACLSFGWLLSKVEFTASTNYIMFCDQDDIWHSNKIEITLDAMLKAEASDPILPILVHTDLVVVDDALNVISQSFWSYEQLDPKRNQLPQFLIQNIATGCTVMINKRLIELAIPIPENAAMHDWWVALVASAFGKIIPVYEQVIDYRQHADNACGSPGYSQNIFQKAIALLNNEIIFNELLIPVRMSFVQAAIFLKSYGSILSTQQYTLVESYVSIAEANFFIKRRIIISNGFYRQGFLRNLMLLLLV